MAIEIQHCIRTVRLKVKAEGYAWLNAAATEVNQVWNFANSTSYKAARPFASSPKWLTAFDLDKLTAVGDWWLCLPVARQVSEFVAPRESVGLDLGLMDTVATSDGAKLRSGHFYRNVEQKIATAQRRGHKLQAKRLYRRAARRRKDALHKFSTQIVNEYQTIVIGDVSSLKLAKTPMAKSVLDAGWGMLKTQLQYKGQQAGRCVLIVSERDSTRTCSSCKALTGPAGLDMLVVRTWVCRACGDTHDRDVNAARNILSAGRCPPSVSGNEPSLSAAQPSRTSSRCEVRNGALKAAA